MKDKINGIKKIMKLPKKLRILSNGQAIKEVYVTLLQIN